MTKIISSARGKSEITSEPFHQIRTNVNRRTFMRQVGLPAIVPASFNDSVPSGMWLELTMA
jgi:hypothetical protein